MKIIKKVPRKNQMRKEWIGKKLECDCGCIFELEQRDGNKIRFEPASQPGAHDYYTILCPSCGEIVSF